MPVPNDPRNSTPSSPSSKLLSKFGARLRTRTFDGGAISEQRRKEDVMQESTPSGRARRPSFVTEEKRHSYNMLGRKSSTSDTFGTSRTTRSRSSSKIFNSLSASFARASLFDEEKGASGPDRNAKIQDGVASASTKASAFDGIDSQGYRQVAETDSPPELEHNTDSFNIHYTSASAYGTSSRDVPEVADSDQVFVEDEGHRSPKRKRRLSISLLSRRWSRADLSAGVDEIKTDASVAQDTSQNSFNLHSFRSVRRASDLSWERRPEQIRSESGTSTYAAMTDVQRNSYALSSATTPPASMLHSQEDVVNRPQQSRSRTTSASQVNGSISAGMFMRAAARSRNEVYEEANGTARSSALNSPCLPPAGSPYRPLTPLGQGAQSPAEELAILEADLAKARSNSLAYLAQLEEKEDLRQRRRLQYHPTSDSFQDHSANQFPTSYFSPAHEHREILPQTSSLFEKLHELEGR